MKTRSLLAALILLGSASHIIAQEANNSPTAQISFATPTYDFGDVEESTQVTHVYTFTNTGKVPLIITNAQGSCGCTIPFYPKVPILPGESSEIQVTFNSSGRAGAQQKSVTIDANTSPRITVLTLKGNVLPATEEVKLASAKATAKKQEQSKKIEEVNPNCFAIYPNPTNNELKLDLKSYIGMRATVHIRNDKGQELFTKTIEKISSETTTYDVSSYTPGIYMITIEVAGQKPMTQCFVVTGG